MLKSSTDLQPESGSEKVSASGKDVAASRVFAAGRVFAAVTFCTYLVPSVAFPLILQLFPNAAPITMYLLTIFFSSFWLLLGWWGLRSMGSSLAAVGLTRARFVTAGWMTLLVWGFYALTLVPQVIASRAGMDQIFQVSLANIFLQWLVVGLFEEILFRGYMLNWLRARFTFTRKWHNDLAALLLTNLIFASMHVPQRLYQVVQGKMTLGFVFTSLMFVFLIGLALSLIYLRTGNLFLAAMAHGSNNAPLIGSTNQVLPLILFLVFVEVVYFIRRRWKPAAAEPQAV